MNRIVTALALALSLASASTAALAAPRGKAPAAHQADRKEKGDRDDKKFPMKADEFKKLVADRVGKARERLEKHIERKNAGPEKAKEIRAKFDAAVARLNKKVEEVTADGTVSKEEAKEVRALAKELIQEHRGHHGKKHPKKG